MFCVHTERKSESLRSKFFKTHLKIVNILPFKNFGTQIHYFHPPMHQIFDDTYRQDPNLILALYDNQHRHFLTVATFR